MAELSIYYRDSFWLLLRGDKEKVLDAGCATEEAAVSESVARMRKAARSAADTAERLAKRSKTRVSEVIDLTD